MPFQNLEDGEALTRAAWAELLSLKDDLGLPDLSIVSLPDFEASSAQGRISMEERLSIIDQAAALFEHIYAHRPFKRVDLALSSLQSLRERAGADWLTNPGFHNLMANSFLLLDDAHTLYGRPAPFRDSFAFLPFQLKHYVDDSGRLRFVVSRVMPGFRHLFFQEGVEIVRWVNPQIGPLPMEEAVRLSAQNEVGVNPSAAMAYGLRRMFLRLLTFKTAPRFPDEFVEYADPDGSNLRSLRFVWGVGSGTGSGAIFRSGGGGCAEVHAKEAGASMMLFRPDKCVYELHESSSKMDSKFTDIFEFQYPGAPKRPGFLNPEQLALESAPEKKFGYIRIKNFDLEHSGDFGREEQIAAEFQRLLEIQMEHAPDGLILDIRGNPGGNVRAAEALLQMLTPNEIHPARFHWIRSDSVRKTLSTLAGSNRNLAAGAIDAGQQQILDLLLPQFEAWLGDLATWDADQLEEAKRLLISGQTWSQQNFVNSIGQIYQGPVVLLVDGFTYSAADIFAGGFQDHGIGPVLGLDESTGGGGAIRKLHSELLPFAPLAGLKLARLPEGVTMSVAVMRSTRVLKSEGAFIEDVGVATDRRHLRRRDDVLRGNPDLIAQACQLLAQRPAYRLKVEAVTPTATGFELKVIRRGFSKLQIELGGKPVEARLSEEGNLQIDSDAVFLFSQPLLLSGLVEEGQIAVTLKTTVDLSTEQPVDAS